MWMEPLGEPDMPFMYVKNCRKKDSLSGLTRTKRRFGLRLVRSNYVNVKQVVKELQIDKVDGILLDLGVSSYQLDTKERGFSYMADAPLDMRMDQSRDFTAKDLVNSYPEEKLYEIIKHYGEERYAKSD